MNYTLFPKNTKIDDNTQEIINILQSDCIKNLLVLNEKDYVYFLYIRNDFFEQVSINKTQRYDDIDPVIIKKENFIKAWIDINKDRKDTFYIKFYFSQDQKLKYLLESFNITLKDKIQILKTINNMFSQNNRNQIRI